MNYKEEAYKGTGNPWNNTESDLNTNMGTVENAVPGYWEDILLLGTEPFVSLPISFRIALAGRCAGNPETVIKDHPVFEDLPRDGFCGWQFGELMEGGNAVCFESDDVPFNPIVEVASVHKFAIRQSAMFEFNVPEGRLLVYGFHFHDNDPAAKWLKSKLVTYMQSDNFNPQKEIDNI